MTPDNGDSGGPPKPSLDLLPEINRSRMILTALDTRLEIDDMNVPGFGLHPLEGRLKGRWSVSVSGNWRITFEFREGNACVLDYEDYH